MGGNGMKSSRRKFMKASRGSSRDSGPILAYKTI